MILEAKPLVVTICAQKKEIPNAVSPKKINYDFLRRHYPHQVKGSKLITSSQPAKPAPLFIMGEV